MTQNRHALIYGGCQLEVSQRCKWNRFETTDTFRPDAIRRTIQVSGFDRAVLEFKDNFNPYWFDSLICIILKLVFTF